MSQYFTERHCELLWNAFLKVQTHRNTLSVDVGGFTHARFASGAYRFGPMQHDISTSPDARKFLQQNGFSMIDIIDLSHQGGLPEDRLAALNQTLSNISDAKINAFSKLQFEQMLKAFSTWLFAIQQRSSAHAEAILNNLALSIGLLDDQNQHGTYGEQLIAYWAGDLFTCPGTSTPIQITKMPDIEDLRRYRLNTKYGVEYPEITNQRIDHIQEVLAKVERTCEAERVHKFHLSKASNEDQFESSTQYSLDFTAPLAIKIN